MVGTFVLLLHVVTVVCATFLILESVWLKFCVCIICDTCGVSWCGVWYLSISFLRFAVWCDVA